MPWASFVNLLHWEWMCEIPQTHFESYPATEAEIGELPPGFPVRGMLLDGMNPVGPTSEAWPGASLPGRFARPRTGREP